MDQPSGPGPTRKPPYPLLMLLVLAAAIILPVMFWQGAWFGKNLSDEKIREYLTSTDKPRHTQHALVQLTDRIDKDAASAKQYYPLVADLTDSPHFEVRNTAAWVMGWDSDSQEFHAALLKLLDDSELVVRQNAALALSNFRDPAGRPVILSMLESQEVTSPAAGRLTDVLQPGSPVKTHMKIGTIADGSDKGVQVKSPIGGTVAKMNAPAGADVRAGQLVATIAPGHAQVRGALGALMLVGEASDVAAIKQVVDHAYPHWGERDRSDIAAQAEETIRAIEERAKSE